MLISLLLYALAAPAPQQAAPDTSQVFTGILGQRFAWGTVALGSGKVLRAYLPASTTGVADAVFYYLSAPVGGKNARLKTLNINEVSWMRVQGQYSELLRPSKREPGCLAARRSAGPLELFVVKVTVPTVVNFLGSAPVLGSPATAAPGTELAHWYLRPLNGPAVLLLPEQFASQAAPLFTQDAELAHHIAAGDAGYRYADVERLVQRYNQRAR